MNFQLIGIIAFIISILIGGILKSRVRKYSSERLSSGLSGKEVAEKMLKDNFIYDVTVNCVDGELSDHYNPKDKTVNLSRDIYYGVNLAAAAIAAHECGHAVQHARAYAFLSFRTAMVPVVGFASKFLSMFIFAGFLALRTFPALLEIGIALFAVTTLFSIVTLPVEFDASSRALSWISYNRIVNDEEYSSARGALTWAALTYVIAAVGSIAQLAHLMSISQRNKNE